MKIFWFAILMIFMSDGGLLAQHTYTWERTGVLMDLPFNHEDADFYEDGEGLDIYLDELEMEFRLLDKDSVHLYFSSPYHEILDALAQEFEVTIISSPDTFPHFSSGSFMVAQDTMLFIDSLILAAFTHPSSPYVILAVFDCYDSPLKEALAIMRSIRFHEAILIKEE